METCSFEEFNHRASKLLMYRLKMWAHLQAHYVNQSFVGDVDVSQDLSDWHSGDRLVERHKQREDWSEPVDGNHKELR